jgi:hypothetical protein
MRMAFLSSPIGLCTIPFCAWAGVSLYNGTADEQAVTPFSVERANKTDRIVAPSNVHGEYLTAISVEVAGKSDAVITVRDRDGRMLYRLDPAGHTTIVSKRVISKPARPRPPAYETTPSGVDKGLPDGCEGAFSPFVEPTMANVIGHCVSEITGNVHIASR